MSSYVARLQLGREWTLGPRIGGGGFGEVYAATCPDPAVGPCVVKLVPKASGAQRELLFVNLSNARNVVPIIESGETPTHWALVMPRADKSLREHMTDAGVPFDVPSAVPILSDIATALADLDGKVVHRDLKPENVLLLNGRWCLADFGISRYAEATTAPDTHKYAMSVRYAAPERWRSERATGATDVYALEIMAFELLSGTAPFQGPDVHDFRDQHLHFNPPAVSDAPAALTALIVGCLNKSPAARPSPQNILTRLTTALAAPVSGGRSRLQQANMQEVARQSESERRSSANQSEAEKRRDLFRDATESFKQIDAQLKATILHDAPAAVFKADRSGGWRILINQATLELSSVDAASLDSFVGRQAPAVDVVAFSSIAVRIPPNRHGYEGRGHSLWFCDAKELGRYGWFETAFMIHPMIRRHSALAPFAVEWGESADKALGLGNAEVQLAWPFMPIVVGDMDEFVDRWVGWFADAIEGRLNSPSMMPEREPGGSWRGN